MAYDESVTKRAVRVLHDIEETASKPVFHYWTKKSSAVATAIISEFLPAGGILLDPFLGSGSTLLGFKHSQTAGMMIGVDVNELPIAISELQVDDEIYARLTVAKKRIEEFAAAHYPYEQVDTASGTGLKFSSAALDLISEVPHVTSLRFGSTRSQVVEISRSSPDFVRVEDAYLRTWERSLGPFSRDRELVTNSRLAAKDGTLISSLFSPISYRFLLEFSDQFHDDLDVLLVLASCLHHCKFTDKGMQSQFPFWFPKRGAFDRSVTEAILRKSRELAKSVAQRRVHERILKRVARFNEETSLCDSRFLLLEKGIQQVSSLDVPDSTVDLVITDPPYFDQVAYSEYLSLWEFFVGLKVNFANEIVESNRKEDPRSRERYLSDLTTAFVNIRRMLKDSGLMFIYFKDSKPRNVSDFVEVLRNAGLNFVAQQHLSGSRRTYKQNSSPESTVPGDCIMVFSPAPSDLPYEELSSVNERGELSDQMKSLVARYLYENGPSSLGELYDNVLIPELIRTRCLKDFRTQEDVFELLKDIKRGEDFRYEA